MTIALIVLLGLVYPMAVYAVGQVAFNDRADGSFVKAADGTTVGSSLIGQSFLDADGKPLTQYFQPRPSAAGAGYDAMSSSASNLGPGNATLLTSIDERVAAYRALNGLADDREVPVDAVTTSGSGLDPQISVANAKLQAARVASARSIPVEKVLSLVDAHTQGRQWGFLGEKAVNVLELNLDLERQG